MPTDRKTIVITDFIEKHDPIEAERRVVGDLADFRILDAHHEDELVGHVEDAEAIVLYHNLPMLSPKTIDRLERCKLIVRGGVGYDNVDATYARARGIPVATVPDYGTEEVADSAIGLMLTMTRGISRYSGVATSPTSSPHTAGPSRSPSATPRSSLRRRRCRGRVSSYGR